MIHLSRRERSQDGFTLIEMVVTLTIIATAFTALAYVLFGSFKAYGSSRQRSAFSEIVNDEIERIRSLPYSAVGVRSDAGAALTSAYGSPPQHEGGDAVLIDPASTNAALVPAPTATVSTSPVQGIVLPYTVKRWVTWHDPNGGTAQRVKRVKVTVEYLENRQLRRTITFRSVVYPGGEGRPITPNTPPVASFTGPATAAAGSPVTFDGTGSSDPDGTVTAWEWYFADTPPASGVGPISTHTFSAPGTYAVSLVAYDNRGKASPPVTKPIQIIGACGVAPILPTPPTADPPNGPGPLDVTFSAAAQDTDGAPSQQLTYRWTFGDGTAVQTSMANSPSLTAISHRYDPVLTTTTRTVSLVVTDPCGQTVAGTTTVTLTAPSPCSVVSMSFQQKSNSKANDLIVETSGRDAGQLPNNAKQIDFEARTTLGCAGAKAQLPRQSGIIEVTLTEARNSPTGYQDWKATYSANDQFDLAVNATRTWDTAAPGTAVKRSEGFTVNGS